MQLYRPQQCQVPGAPQFDGAIGKASGNGIHRQAFGAGGVAEGGDVGG